jgi:S1-C subfamily serine protease
MSDDVRKKYDIPANVNGAVVTVVEPGSVADRLGITPGYVITQVGDKQIRSSSDLADAMKSVNWGDTVQISFGQFVNGRSITRSQPVEFR